MRVLIIEDDRDLAQNIAEFLEARGVEMDFASDGVSALHLGTLGDFDALVLDLTLPGLDGLEVCRRLREDAQLVSPILMLTARDGLEDRLRGFEVGTDDYLVKPFSLQELYLRLRALVRRARGDWSRVGSLRVGDLTFDLEQARVCRSGAPIELGPIDRKLLELLMRRSPAVVGQAEIESFVWGGDEVSQDLVRTHIYQLRKAIDRSFDRALVRTVRGSGYAIREQT